MRGVVAMSLGVLSSLRLIRVLPGCTMFKPPPNTSSTGRADRGGQKIHRVILAASILGVSACGEQATLPDAAGFGPSPQLPPPHATVFPTVNIAPAKGWRAGATPTAAPGLKVTALAEGLDHPRWLYVLPNGDILVAETNAPAKPEDNKGIRGWVMGLVMARAGASAHSANRITLLRPTGDGTAQTSVFLEGLNSPFGMVLVGDELYVADTDALVRYAYRAGQTRITAPSVKLVDLPAGPINHHWTKNVVASADGQHLVRDSRFEQQCGRQRRRGGGRPRRHLGGRSAHRAASDFRVRARAAASPTTG